MSYRDLMLESSPSAYWPLQRDAADLVGSAGGSIVGSAAASAGAPEGFRAGSFALTGGHIQLPPGLVQWPDYTMECWAKVNVLDELQTLFYFGQSASANGFGGDLEIHIALRELNGFAAIHAKNAVDTAVSDTAWHHFAQMYSSGTLSFWIDGTQLGSVAVPSFSFDDQYNYIGVTPSGVRNLQGNIAHCALHARALTLDEVSARASYRRKRYEIEVERYDVWALWPLDRDGLNASGITRDLNLRGNGTYHEPLIAEGQSYGDGYATLPPDRRTGSWAMQAWVETGNVNARQVLFDLSNRNQGLMVQIYNGRLWFCGKHLDNATNTRSFVRASTSISSGEEYFITAVYDHDSGGQDYLRIYIDDAERANGRWDQDTPTTHPNIEKWGIGGTGLETFDEQGDDLRSGDGEYLFQGHMDEVAIYQQPLTQSEIARTFSYGSFSAAEVRITLAPANLDASAYVVPTATARLSAGSPRGTSRAYVVPRVSADLTGPTAGLRARIYTKPYAEADFSLPSFGLTAFGINSTGADKAYVRSMRTGSEISFRKRSLSGRQQLGSCDSASFSFDLERGEPMPLAVGEPIRISADEREEEILLGGLVTRLSVNELSSEAAGAPEGLRRVGVEVQCFTALAQRRLVAGVWRNVRAGTVVEDLVAQSVAEDGVVTTLPDGETSTVSDGPELTRVSLKYQRLSDAMDRLAERSGFSWYIDAHKRMQFFARTEHRAPLEIMPDSRPYTSLTVSEGKEQYRNRQIIKGGKELTVPRTETFRGDGRQLNFTTRFPVGEKPTVRVNGEPQSVGIGDLDDNSAWYWNKGRNVISQDEEADRLENTDTLEVLYRGIVPVMVEHTDAEAAAQRKAVEGGSGLHERIDTDTSIERREAASEKATALLRKYAQVRETVQLRTREGGLKKGQLLSLDLPEMDLHGDYLIDSLSWQTDDREQVVTTLTLVSGESFGGWQGFFRDLLRSAEDTTVGEEEQVLVVREFRSQVRVTHGAMIAPVETREVTLEITMAVDHLATIRSTPSTFHFGDKLGKILG